MYIRPYLMGYPNEDKLVVNTKGSVFRASYPSELRTYVKDVR